MEDVDTRRALKEVFSTWSGLDCSTLRLTLALETRGIASPTDGVNSVQWVDSGWVGRGFSPTAAGATQIQFDTRPDGSRRFREVDIYLNAEGFAWVLDEQPGADDSATRSLTAVLTHQVGLAVGLVESCLRNDSGTEGCSHVAGADLTAMYPEYAWSQASLAPDDIAGACSLYPSSACKSAQCSEDELCSDGACLQLCAGQICEDHETCSPEGCIPRCTVGDCDLVCLENSQCGPNGSCVDKRCVPGTGVAGDPCETSRDCGIGGCLDGSCESECVQALQACESQECDDVPACGELGLGNACVDDSQCLSADCQQGPGPEKVCTRACDDATPCPTGFYCWDSGGGDICVDPKSGDGCAVSVLREASRELPRPGTTAVAAALLLLFGLRFRSSRRYDSTCVD